MTDWTRHHRIVYVLLGSVSLDGPPSDAAVGAVGQFMTELMNLGVMPGGDGEFEAIWTAAWLRVSDDRKPGGRGVAAAAAEHARILRREVDPGTAATLVALGLVPILRATGGPSPAQLMYLQNVGSALGVG